jgi:cytochrome c553
MRIHRLAVAAACGLSAASAAAQTGDAALGRNLAATCANCHGTNGTSVGGFDPLAGEAKDQIVRKMMDFKAGTRPGTIMPQLAKGYTDAQIALIAEYFASQKPAK